MNFLTYKTLYIAVFIAIAIGIALFNPKLYPIFSAIPPNTSMQEQNQNTSEMKNVDMFPKPNANEVASQEVSYFENATGLYAAPKDDGVYPGVVMIHEWWGLNDNIKETARHLAGEGYRVLAVDLYKGQVAVDATGAQKLMGEMDQNVALENLKAAVAFLKDRGATKMASLGWCFGGGQSLKLSLSGVPLDATVVYYGSLVTDPKQLSSITWPLLGIFGETDQSIPPAKVREFEQALNTAGVKNSITIYPGVGHAFANPSGANYAPEPTMDAWEKTLAFLRQNLKSQ